ncbi:MULTISPECIES: hypothetical protein [unclassified Nonomuraea]|nr:MULTISPECIES: hypothetical protein [unclassified Nonomuraea]
MASDARTPQLGDELPHVAARLAAQLARPATLELLDGAAGAALALHSFATGTVVSGWDTFLLLG